MIGPDTKNWTWVLTRSCPECGFDASQCQADEVAGLVRQNAQAWEDLLEEGAIKPGRPDASTWSTLEYAGHVRDVYRRFFTRIDLMLSEDDPLFDNWDQDASAVEDAYEQQVPASVVHELTVAAGALATQLDQVSGPAWQRPGRRSDGVAFRVETIAPYTAHDVVHHVWDVSRQRR
ncbi:MAG: DinB family protein [Acidimicrobiales bacterium]